MATSNDRQLAAGSSRRRDAKLPRAVPWWAVAHTSQRILASNDSMCMRRDTAYPIGSSPCTRLHSSYCASGRRTNRHSSSSMLRAPHTSARGGASAITRATSRASNRSTRSARKERPNRRTGAASNLVASVRRPEGDAQNGTVPILPIPILNEAGRRPWVRHGIGERHFGTGQEIDSIPGHRREYAKPAVFRDDEQRHVEERSQAPRGLVHPGTRHHALRIEDEIAGHRAVVARLGNHDEASTRGVGLD